MDSDEVVCKYCQEDLEEFGFICFEILETVCQNYIDGEESFYCDSEFRSSITKTIRFLEHKGYVLTTEAENGLVEITPWNYCGDFYDDEELFCWCENV